MDSRESDEEAEMEHGLLSKAAIRHKGNLLLINEDANRDILNDSNQYTSVKHINLKLHVSGNVKLISL